MRIALFITCFNDTLFPGDRPGGRDAARAARARGRLPARADLLRADARQHRLSRRGAARSCGASCACSPASEAVVSPSGSCVGDGARALPAARGRGRRRGAGGAVRALAPRVFELSRVPRRPPRRRGRRRVASRTASPTTRPATRCALLARRRRAAAAAARACAGSSSSSCRTPSSAAASAAPSRSRTPTPRSRCSTDKLRAVLDTGAEVCTAVDNSCLMHIGGGLRRQRAGVRADAPGRDPGLDGVSRRTRLPAPRRATRWPTRSCGATSRHATDDDPRQARAAWSPSCPTGRRCARRARAIKERALRHLDEHLERSRRRCSAPAATVHWARDAAEANAHRRRARARARARARSSRSSRWPPTRSGSTRRSPRPASHALETDLAELIVQLGDDRPSHILVPAIHRNRAEIRDLFRAHDRRRRASPTSRRELAEAARRHLREQFLRARVGDQRRELRRRRDRAPSCVVESEGNGRMCTTLPETLDHGAAGSRRSCPTLAGPRGVPAAAAALLDRRADEPLHVAVDRGDATATGRRSSTSCCSTTAAPTCSPTRSGAQALRCIRCSACLNVCPVYERTGGHAYGSVYPGPIGAILTPQLDGLEHAPTAAVRLARCAAPATRSAR